MSEVALSPSEGRLEPRGRGWRELVGSALAVLALVLSPIVAPVVAQPAEAATYKVCAPKGKCVYVSRVCKPGACGQLQTYKPWPAGMYCSSSVGCFTYKGVNYSYGGGPRPTAAQQAKIVQCAANLGFTWVVATAGGPVGWTIGGVALAVWGCAT